MSLLWLRVAVLLYGVAALAVLPAALYNRQRWRHLAVPVALAGAFFHFVSIAETFYAAHRALPVDTHETLSLLGLLLAVAFLLLAAKYRTVAFGIFLLPVISLPKNYIASWVFLSGSFLLPSVEAVSNRGCLVRGRTVTVPLRASFMRR